MKKGGGMLRERLTFEQRRSTDDGAGNFVTSWLPFVSTYARVKPLTGGEEVVAARLAGIVRYEITVRGSSQTRQIWTDFRAVDDRTGKIYNIRAIVNPDERGAYLIMTCDDGPVDG